MRLEAAASLAEQQNAKVEAAECLLKEKLMIEEEIRVKKVLEAAAAEKLMIEEEIRVKKVLEAAAAEKKV